ncbi:MAG: histidine--tRNA ligase [Vicinamibacterales bacterium]|nr:histidine--tRNA ligase [Vicinamibacterales bacterium]
MSTQPARGMRDFLPDDVRRRQYVMGVIARVYEQYGFAPLETPAVENIETLLGKYGEEGDRLIFKILKRGEGAATGQADLALRYDLTVPLARVVAEYRATLPKFFKRYQMQPVWRADRPQKGRFREFYQCDVDAIGSHSVVVEVELLAAACDVLARLGFADFTVRLNHRKALSGMLQASGVPAALHGETLVALDKLDKIGPDGVTRELAERGVAPAAAAALIALFSDGAAGNDAILARLEAVVGGDEAGATGVRELRAILALAAGTRAAARLRLDPSLARGLSYYTGAIFEIAVPDLAGSLGGGGRYDDLIGMFGKQAVPACGISLGLERILVVMGERGMFPPDLALAAADVMVAVWSEARLADSVALAAELRAGGLRVEVYPEADKLGKQFKYASACGVPFVAVLGDDEAARGEVALKDMRTGVQRSVPRADAGREMVAARGQAQGE